VEGGVRESWLVTRPHSYTETYELRKEGGREKESELNTHLKLHELKLTFLPSS